LKDSRLWVLARTFTQGCDEIPVRIVSFWFQSPPQYNTGRSSIFVRRIILQYGVLSAKNAVYQRNIILRKRRKRNTVFRSSKYIVRPNFSHIVSIYLKGGCLMRRSHVGLLVLMFHALLTSGCAVNLPFNNRLAYPTVQNAKDISASQKGPIVVKCIPKPSQTELTFKVPPGLLAVARRKNTNRSWPF
jgi:hypothetical protein